MQVVVYEKKDSYSYSIIGSMINNVLCCFPSWIIFDGHKILNLCNGLSMGIHNVCFHSILGWMLEIQIFLTFHATG
jgi:hypothetical protein